MYKILVTGAGSIGERHVRCFLASGRAAVSVCETRADLRARIAQDYPLAHAIADYDEALAQDWDAVVIATPAHLHIPMALAAARRGFNLLIEKPLSVAPDGVDELRSVVAQRELTVAAGYTWRSYPALHAMRDAIASGRFGSPRQVVVTVGQNFPFWRPAYRDTYYRSHHTGGGAIQDALTHMFNVAQWFVGPATRLVADAAHLALPGVDVEDTAHVLSRHGNVLASFALNQHQMPNEWIVTIVCADGTVRFENSSPRWRWVNQPNGQWHDEVFAPLTRDDPFILQASAFLDALAHARPPLCSLDDAADTLQMNLAALASVRTGAWQTIPPLPQMTGPTQPAAQVV